jgi:hypothetical protein
MEQIKVKRTSGNELMSKLSDLKSKLEGDLGIENVEAKLYSIFFETLLFAGHKTLSHVFNMIEKYNLGVKKSLV